MVSVPVHIGTAKNKRFLFSVSGRNGKRGTLTQFLSRVFFMIFSSSSKNTLLVSTV